MSNYDVQEEVIKSVVQKYPSHNSYASVEVKAKLLNLFYSTGIQAIDKVIEKIMSISNIDTILNRPSYNKKLVDAIADLQLSDGTTRTNYSFATKYCALHQPEKYPIYDSIVGAVFTKLMVNGELPPYQCNTGRKVKSKGMYMTMGEFRDKLHDYDFFVQVYKTFMTDYGLSHLSYRMVDWYIWGSYKDGQHKSIIEQIAPLVEGKDYTVIRLKQIKKTLTIK